MRRIIDLSGRDSWLFRIQDVPKVLDFGATEFFVLKKTGQKRRDLAIEEPMKRRGAGTQPIPHKSTSLAPKPDAFSCFSGSANQDANLRLGSSAERPINRDAFADVSNQRASGWVAVWPAGHHYCHGRFSSHSYRWGQPTENCVRQNCCLSCSNPPRCCGRNGRAVGTCAGFVLATKG